MQPTTLTLHTAYQIGEVDPRIFGGFLEHMGRAVYQGVYDPKSAHADAEGFRKDVLAALEPLSMTVRSEPFEAIEVRGARAHLSLPPLSVMAATLELET
jgi:alpha-N-arabinofuranosidase